MQRVVIADSTISTSVPFILLMILSVEGGGGEWARAAHTRSSVPVGGDACIT
jgi:hypothetical protein